MREVVICEPLRTPIGRYGGALSQATAVELGVAVVQALLERTGVNPDDLDDVIFGQCYPNGEAPAVGRIVALDAGLSPAIPGYQLDRRCGSSLQAVINATMQVATGGSDAVIAGGVESMSQVEYAALGLREKRTAEEVRLVDRLKRARQTAGGVNYPVPGGMLETAENVRRLHSIPREEQDWLAEQSHARAVRAMSQGLFAQEIVPVPAAPGVVTDEHPRPDTTADSLARLRPVMLAQDAEATVTAGNASGQNDGASACLVTTAERARTLPVGVAARLLSWAVAGVEPKMMGLGPVPAIAKALDRSGLELSDIDLIELNEAFAAQVLGCTRELGFTPSDFDRLNVNGSGISLGHPVGATGARLLTTGLRELDRRGGRYLLVTMCIGGGQGLAAVFERVSGE